MVQAAVEKVLSSGELKGSDISGDRYVSNISSKIQDFVPAVGLRLIHCHSHLFPTQHRCRGNKGNQARAPSRGRQCPRRGALERPIGLHRLRLAWPHPVPAAEGRARLQPDADRRAEEDEEGERGAAIQRGR